MVKGVRVNGTAIKKLEPYSKSEIQDCLELLQYIYCNDDECFVRALSKSKGINRVYPINSLKEPIKLGQVLRLLGREDVYLNLNPFRVMGKTTRKNLLCINAIAIDVDYKKVKEFKDLEPNQIIKLLELDFFGTKIPEPNFVEQGNQLRLIYTVETCYIPKNRDNVVILAKRISEVFSQELIDYGAEKQNLETYFRVPGSINSKNGAAVKILAYENSIRYTLKELQELWLEELPKWYKRRKGRTQSPKKVIKLHNVYTLNSNRLIDFELIQSHLNNIGENDLRVRLCFLYRNFMLIRTKYQNGVLREEDFIDAKNGMLEFNRKFNTPLRDHAIESATRCVNTKQYLYKNETLVRFLEIDYELCEELGLQSIYKVKEKEEINKDYRNRNNNKLNKKKKEKYQEKLKKAGKVSERDKISQRRGKIKDLLGQGLKQKDICIKLSISKRTCINDIKFLKEQGLI